MFRSFLVTACIARHSLYNTMTNDFSDGDTLRHLAVTTESAGVVWPNGLLAYMTILLPVPGEGKEEEEGDDDDDDEEEEEEEEGRKTTTEQTEKTRARTGKD